MSTLVNSSKTLWLITDDTTSLPEKDLSYPEGSRESTRDTGGRLGSNRDTRDTARRRRRVGISTTKLRQEFEEFIEAAEEVFSQLNQKQSALNLDEVEVEVEVNAEGQFSLLGTGGKVGSKGAIRLKFKL